MLDSSCITPLFHDCESPWCFAHLRREGYGYNAGVKQCDGGHTTTSRGRGLSLRKKLAFTGAVMLFLCLLCDAAGWGWFYAQYGQSPRAWVSANIHRPDASCYESHPYLPYVIKPNISIGAVVVNSLGMRGPEVETPKRRERVLCFGGSTTWCGDMAERDSWPGALREMLGGEVEVINAATNGYTTADTLVSLALRRIDLQPDYVLIYHGTNDLESSYTPGFQSDYSHRRQDIDVSLSGRYVDVPDWMNCSSLVVLARRAVYADGANIWNLYTRTTSRDFGEPRGTATFERNLREIAAIARTANAKTLIGTFQINADHATQFGGREFADAWQRGIDLQNEVIHEIAADTDGAHIVHVNGRVPADSYNDFCHVNAEGNRAIATAFFEVITSLRGQDK